MIFATREFLVHARLDEQTLDLWVEEGWIIPDEADGARAFHEADVARAGLIRELMEDMGVNAEGVGIVLNLIDQVHGLRGALAEVAERGGDRN